MTVPVGQVLVPVITTGVTIGFVAAGDAQAESSPVAAVTTLTPTQRDGQLPDQQGRLGRFPHGMEDAFRHGANRRGPERD